MDDGNNVRVVVKRDFMVPYFVSTRRVSLRLTGSRDIYG